MIWRLALALCLLLSVGVATSAQATTVSYALVPGFSLSTTYTMTVNGQNVPVQAYHGHSFAWFAFDGAAAVVVTVNQTVTTYTLSPKRNPTSSVKDGATISFTFASGEPKKLVLHEVNAIAEKLFIFGDALEVSPPASSGTGIYNVVTGYGADATGVASSSTAFTNAIDAATAGVSPYVVYVPAGVYSMTASVYVKTNVHLYLAPGAVIRVDPGTYTTVVAFIVQNATNARISGRGVFNGLGPSNTSYLNMMHTSDASAFNLEGVMMLDSRSTALRLGTTADSSVRNVKILSANGTSLADGIDLDGVTNVTVDNSFVYSTDDAIAITAGGDSFHYRVPVNTDGVVISDTLIYQSATGHCMSIYGNAPLDYIKNITFSQNDGIDCGSAFGFYASNGFYEMKTITITNSRIEHVRRSFTYAFTADFLTGWGGEANGYWSSLSGVIKDVTFSNVRTDDLGTDGSIFSGRDGTRFIDNIRFDNVTVGAALATSITDLQLSLQSFVTNINFGTLSAPSTAILDTFNRPNESPLTATNWTILSGTGHKVLSNQGTGVDAAGGNSRWKTQFGSDQEVYITLVNSMPTDTVFDMDYRGDTLSSLDNHYIMRIQNLADTNWYIVCYVFVNGSPTFVNLVDTLVPFPANSVVRVTVIGTQHTFYLNGVQVMQLTEATIQSGGYIGIQGINTVTFDNFGGGTLGGPVVPTGLHLAQGGTFVWSPCTGGNIAGYKLYEGTVSGQTNTVLATTDLVSAAAAHSPPTRYISRFQTPGLRYFTVSCFTTDGFESEKSSEVSYTDPGMSARSPRIPTP